MDQYHPVMFPKVHESVFFFENTFTLLTLSPVGVVLSSAGVVFSTTVVAHSKQSCYFLELCIQAVVLIGQVGD